MRYLGALAAALLLTAIATAGVDGATHTWTVTPEVAAPGDHVTDAIHDFGGGGAAFRGTDLYLILESRLTDGPPCSEMLGAVKVAVIVWTDNGLYHEGLAQFTLPVVPDGRYWLGEEVPGTTPSCIPSGLLTVSASRIPNTAMRDSAPGPRIVLTLAWLVILVSAIWIARARLGDGRGDR